MQEILLVTRKVSELINQVLTDQGLQKMEDVQRITEMVEKAAHYISGGIAKKPEVGMVLGTGLGSLFDDIKNPVIFPYEEIPYFPVSTAPSHKGRLVIGTYGGKEVVIMQGRFHYYEGYSMQQVTFPVRLLKQLGVRTLIVTNASGSLVKELQPGGIVLIKDHINFMGTNPLLGPNDPEEGERFPSMHDNYCSELRERALDIAQQENIDLKQGVYIGVTGPSMETKSECTAFARWGADIVGMSTVPEVIVAVYCGMAVLGFSIVGNYSNLFHRQTHDQKEIQSTAAMSYPQLRKLITKILEKI